MTLEQFELYLHDWLKTKLNVANEKVERAYQNTTETPSYPYYTFHVENSDDETEEIDNLDGTQDEIILNTCQVCIKAYTNENYNKALNDLRILSKIMQRIDEVETMKASRVIIKPNGKVISLKEEIQENEFVDMAMLEITAEFQEITVRTDLGYYDTFTGTFESEIPINTSQNLEDSIIFEEI